MSKLNPISSPASTRNKERTRTQILAAATVEFADNGFAGARVETIAERSGSNKRMLYYYFESKETLFVAVMEEAYKAIRQAELTLRLEHLAPEKAIAALIKFTWSYYIEHPEFLRLLNTENLYHAEHIRKSQQISLHNSKLIDTLRLILQNGVSEGAFRSDVDPLQLYISIAGLSYFYLSNNATLSVVFDCDLESTKARNKRLRHMIALVLGYLQKGH